MQDTMMQDYIGTYTGRKFHFMSPSPDEICLDDITIALANTTRYGGHCRFYSVAEHSVLLATYIMNKYKSAEMALFALMHDASEAYLGDIQRPLKQHLSEYKAIEVNVSNVILAKYGIKQYDKVLDADIHIVADEAKVLWKELPVWCEVYTPLGISDQIRGYTPDKASYIFRMTLSTLMLSTGRGHLIDYAPGPSLNLLEDK